MRRESNVVARRRRPVDIDGPLPFGGDLSHRASSGTIGADPPPRPRRPAPASERRTRMEEREGRSVLLYVLLDVSSDDEAAAAAEELGQTLAGADDRVVGYAVGSVEVVQLTF